jgi:hypothetical protein
MKQTLMRNTLDGKQLATVQKKLKRAEKRIAKATSRLSGKLFSFAKFWHPTGADKEKFWFFCRNRERVRTIPEPKSKTHCRFGRTTKPTE